MINLKQTFIRTISGAVFVAVLIASLLISNWSFLALMLVLSSIAMNEFHKITYSYGRIEINRAVAITTNCFLQIGTFAYVFSEEIFAFLEQPVPENRLFFFAPFVLMIIVTFLFELFRQKKRPLHDLAYFALGQIFVAVPFASFYGVLGWDDKWQPLLLLSIFIIIWTNDTFAYLVGSTLGRNKMIKHISPNKSWEGFFGGIAFSLIAGFLLWHFQVVPDFSLTKWFIFALLVSIFGTFGDLMESLLKRASGVKDAGNIIPGHGGILDRFDSVMLAAPIIYIYLMFIENLI